MAKVMSNLEVFANVLKLEANALDMAYKKLLEGTENNADKLVQLFNRLLETKSSLHFCGVGKSGMIAQKCASTFTSLGLPSYFLHPTEALHGDLGRIRSTDAIVFLSKSGTTEEILKLIPFLPTQSENHIGLIGANNSPIEKECTIFFDCSVEKEACINNQAPTTSSTLALAFGDAMAVLFEHCTGLSKEGFAFNHPGGILGKTLRIRVKDLMILKENCPIVKLEENLEKVILEMTKFPVGACAVVENEKFCGILVEGDIRRTFANHKTGLATLVKDIFNSKPISIESNVLAGNAIEKMETKGRTIHILPVVDNNEFLGFIRLDKLLSEGFSLKN